MLSKQNKKVLIIAFAFPPNAYVGTFRTLRFCRYLPENGWKPIVLTIVPLKEHLQDATLLQRLPPDTVIHRTRTIDVIRLLSRSTAGAEKSGNKPVVAAMDGAPANVPNKWRVKTLFKQLGKPLFNLVQALVSLPDQHVFWVPFAVARGIGIMFKEKCDVIFTSSPPHSEHFTGMILSKLFRKPWIADFRDSMIDVPEFHPAPYRFAVLKTCERLFMSQASTVITVTNRHRAILVARYPRAEHKIKVITNGFDPALYATAETEQFDKFTLLYTGSFYIYNTILDFFYRSLATWWNTLSTTDKDLVQVLFYTYENDKFSDYLRQTGLDKVVHHYAPISQNEIIKKQKGAHGLLYFISFTEQGKGHIPSKVFEYIASNRPILGIMPDGDAADILKTYHSFHWVNNLEGTLVIDILDKLFTQWKTGQAQSPINNTIGSLADSAFNARNQIKVLSSYFSNL